MLRFTFTLVVLLIAVVSVSAQDTVQVKAGWNIIGSVKSGAVPEILSTDPPGIITSSFYGYSFEGYQSADTLEKGLGYWVKVSADGYIVFGASTSEECGAQRVKYAGRTYHTIQIGSQCWLEENLDVGTRINGVNNQTNNSQIEKFCYNDDPLNCALYGGLYQWDEAMQYTTTPGAQGICPIGWHIPTLGEFQTLSTTVGDDGNALKREDQGIGGGAGTNTFGFSALLGGYRELAGTFFNLGNYAIMWSSTEVSATNAYYLTLSYNGSSITFGYNNVKNYGFSVRCLKD